MHIDHRPTHTDTQRDRQTDRQTDTYKYHNDLSVNKVNTYEGKGKGKRGFV